MRVVKINEQKFCCHGYSIRVSRRSVALHRPHSHFKTNIFILLAVMSLPTRIKMGIRDSWDNPDSDVQKSIAKLKSTLGVSIHITPQWQLLWTDLQPTYQDMGIFVPNLASVVYCWCTSLEALLDKGENEEWTEELLEKLGSTHGLNMLLEVQTRFL